MLDPEKAAGMFDIAWNLCEFPEAIKVYVDAGRPLWMVAEIAVYYESVGKFAEALGEWQYLIDLYFEMGERLLPLLLYPREVLLLGTWHATTDKVRAARYLSEYVRVANKWGGQPLFYLPHKDAAQRLLEKVEQ